MPLFYILQLVKSLLFHIPEALKRYPFRVESPRIGFFFIGHHNLRSSGKLSLDHPKGKMLTTLGARSFSTAALTDSGMSYLWSFVKQHHLTVLNLDLKPIFLRAHDCKYRESLARLKKSKILIICQKNPFGELSSKKLFSTFKNL